MKIAHVVDSMEVGGAETLVWQMCRLQREQGHQPEVFAIAALGAIGERMQAEGFPIRTNMGKHLVDSAGAFLSAFRSSRPDAVHLHNPTPAIYAAIPARIAGVGSVVSTRHSLVAPPHNRAMERKYAVAARFCNWIVGICDATTDNLRSMHTLPPKKIVRVYNGTAPLQRATIEQRPAKSGFTLVYVGRLEPVKNHALLLNALQIALVHNPDLRLWMVGDGSERQMLVNLAAELNISAQVTFWGQQLDVAPFFSAADAFIMSSKSEGLPVSLLQSFSLGLPAVVTDVGGMAEVVRLSGSGHIVPMDPAKMAGAILQLAKSRDERQRFSDNAKTAFDSYFSLHGMVENYMNLYQRRS